MFKRADNTSRRWVIGLAAGAAGLLLAAGSYHSSTKSGGETVENGRILVVPLQLERDKYGLAMVDTGLKTLWVYEIGRRAPVHQGLRLVAARTWEYDRLLQQLNNDEPTVEQVKTFLGSLNRGGPEDENNIGAARSGKTRDSGDKEEK